MFWRENYHRQCWYVNVTQNRCLIELGAASSRAKKEESLTFL
jgi:hypothetical protein